MAASTADTIATSLFPDKKSSDARYINPELYTLRKPFNVILFALAALTAYPQITGQDKINCMPHSPCNITGSLDKCGTRPDGYTITDLPYNFKLFIDDACKQSHTPAYRYYILYILLAVAAVNIIVQRLWKILPKNDIFVTEFLKLVEDAEKDAGLAKLFNKISMPRLDDSYQCESRAEENVQVMHHLLSTDSELEPQHRHSVIVLIDRAGKLRGSHDSHSISLLISSILSTLLHLALTLTYLVTSIRDSPVFHQEFQCKLPSMNKDHSHILCNDLQAVFLTVIRYGFQAVLLFITLIKLIMELRVQIEIHWTYSGNLQNILRYKLYEKKNVEKKHRDLLYLMVHLKLYDQDLFNKVSLLMSEQIREVRRRQRMHEMIVHLQAVVRAGKLGCVRHFIRHLRRLQIQDTDGNLHDHVSHHGDVEVYLTDEQTRQFKNCLNTVVADDDGLPQTALHRAVTCGKPEVVEQLTMAGADVNVRDHEQETPLHKAMRMGLMDVTEVLMRSKADFTLQNNKGETPVQVAGDKKQLWDLMCLAVRAGDDMDLMKTLIETGVDLNFVRPDVGSLLHVAVHKNSSKIINLLLENGANIELKDSKHRTPLQVAAIGGSLKVVKILVEAGADMTVNLHEDDLLLTVADLAKRNERMPVRVYIQKAYDKIYLYK